MACIVTRSVSEEFGAFPRLRLGLPQNGKARVMAPALGWREGHSAKAASGGFVQLAQRFQRVVGPFYVADFADAVAHGVLLILG